MPDLTFHELQHIQKLLQQQGSLKYIFDDFVKKTGNLLTQWNEYPSGDIWSKNQSVQKAIEEEMAILRTKLTANIENYTTDAWNRSNLKSDELVDGFVKNLALNDVVKNGMYARNNEALQAFLKRKVEGENLSQRVWKIVEGAKTNIEFYLESGLSTGRSAALISQDIRQLLQEPDRRFHRIRNADGKLIPSAPMAEYHPGQGVYRSSFKNALRLAATNTNEMYRLTDNERWQKLDFVIGYKVSRAKNNYGPCAICDAMVGNYPKTYVFTGNHPFCICYAVPILMNEDDFIDALVDDDFSNVKYIDDIPANGRKYIQDLIDNKKLSVDGYLLKGNKGFFDGSAKVKQNTSISSKKYQEVVRLENGIRKNKFETGYLFDSEGKYLAQSIGNKNSTSVPSEASIGNCIFTHNHPSGNLFPVGDMRRIGFSFSQSDIVMAIKFNMSEMRATTPAFTFIAKRPESGWPSVGEFIGGHNKRNEEVFEDFIKRINKGTTTQKKAETIHWHLVNRKALKDFGIGYSKERIK